MKINILLQRSCCISISLGMAIFMSSCASGPMDPGRDDGLLPTLKGTLGGFQQTIDGKKEQFETAQQEGAGLKNSEIAKTTISDNLRVQIATLKSEIGDLDRQLGDIDGEINRYMAKVKNSADRKRVQDCENELNELKERTHNLDTSSKGEGINAEKMKNLAEELKRLKNEKDRLVAVYDAILN